MNDGEQLKEGRGGREWEYGREGRGGSQRSMSRKDIKFRVEGGRKDTKEGRIPKCG
jgi:hypothetical protein